MNLNQLRIFHSVMRTETLTEAAHVLGTSQPAVSKALKQIEAQLGMRLFSRFKGRLYPTAEARRLFETATEIFNKVGYFERQVTEMRDGSSGHIIVSAIPTLAGSLVARAVARLRQSRPGVDVDIKAITSTEVVQAVANERADLGVVYAPFEDVTTQAKDLPRAEIICAVPRRHRLAKRPAIGPTDLQGVPLISFPDDSPVFWLLQKSFQSAGVPFSLSVVANQTLTAYSLVRAGAGVALVDPFLSLVGAFPDVVTKPFRPAVHLRPRVLHPRTKPIASRAGQLINELRKASLELEQ